MIEAHPSTTPTGYLLAGIIQRDADIVVDVPNGINSTGIFFKVLIRCETV